MNPTEILSTYQAVGQHYAILTQPYALHLVYLLTTIELATIGLTYMLGSDDIPELPWRVVRLVFTAGFAYFWIENSWHLGMTVIGSFNQLGQNITGLPELTPGGFIKIGTSIAHILWNAPSAAGWLPEIPLAIGKLMLATLILVIMVMIAAVVIFTLAAAFLIIGPGAFLVALLPNRYTAPICEGYFTWLVRTGIMVLFFFVVLGAAQTFATEWNTQLTAACGAVAGKCTGDIPVETLLVLLGDTIVLAFIAIGVPFTAGAIVGHGVSMALEHFASAKYLAAGSGRKVASAVSGLSHAISRSKQSHTQQTTLQQRIAAGAAAAAKNPPPQSQVATQKLPPQTPVNSFGVPRTKNLNGGGKPTTRI